MNEILSMFFIVKFLRSVIEQFRIKNDTSHSKKNFYISLQLEIAPMNKEKDTCKEEVFNALYRDHAQSLHNFLYFKTTNKDQSHDIAQEAFIKLWNNCKKVSPEKAKSFLFTVANNLFLNAIAHQKVVLNFKKSKTTVINEQSPEYLMEEKEFEARLNKAIADLTEVQRTAFLLSRVEGKKYKEIAEILGISEKAAGKRIHDALEALREQIEKI